MKQLKKSQFKPCLYHRVLMINLQQVFIQLLINLYNEQEKNLLTLLTAGIAVSALLLTGGCKKTATFPTTKMISPIQPLTWVNLKISIQMWIIWWQASATGGIDQRTGTPSEDLQFNFTGCALVTRDTVLHTLTIDFGTGCTGHDGRLRSGKVIVTYSGGGYFLLVLHGSLRLITTMSMADILKEHEQLPTMDLTAVET